MDIWTTIRQPIIDAVTSLAAKWVQRAVTYGTAAIAANIGVQANATTQTQVVAYLVTVAAAAVGMALDWLQHRYDQKPAVMQMRMKLAKG